MASPIATSLVLLGVLAGTSPVQGQVDICATTISNFYVNARERIFNQTTQFLLSAFSGNPLGTEVDLYRQLLMDLGLDDTPEREQTFSRAFSQIIAANTRACTEIQGQSVSSMNLTEVVAELRNALDSGSDLNSVRDIFGRALCLRSLVQTGSNSSFVTDLSNEDRGRIFGLEQRPYSLGFVVDDTGSMAEEIARVQQIILDFVNSDVGAPTHYILTSFNDPSVGTPMRYESQDATARQQLLAAVNALSANGGDDCPELGMAGIINALSLSFPEGQLILLTDASAKDSSRTSEAIQAAFQLGATVHFAFTGTTGCGSGYPFYNQVSNATGGFSVFGLENLDALSNAIQDARVNFVEADEPTVSSAGTCRAVDVSIFAERLYIAINPGALSAEVSLQMPNGSEVFGRTSISTLLVQNFNFPASGEWLICIYSGSVDVKQSQDIRFDMAVEFLVQDDTTGMYISGSTPPFTRLEVIAILFTTRLADLSTTRLHTLRIVDVNGNDLMDVPLVLCDRFLEGRYTLPPVRYRLFFSGTDNNNNSIVVDLGAFPAGPQTVTCSPPCENGGICNDGNTCLCPPGYLGSVCEEQAVCAPPCENGGICVNHNECMCTFGYAGPACSMPDITDCIAPADINLCQNGGTCRLNLLTNSISCACPTAFIGDYCEQRACEVTSASPLLGSFEGGATVTLEVSSTCNLTSVGIMTPTCTFGSQSVPATVVNSMQLTCVVPQMDMPGNVRFRFEAMTAGYGNLEYENMFSAVQCSIAVTPRPFEDYVVGGSTVSLAISDPCFLASDDTPNCIFDGFMVPAERSDANTGTCVVPSMSDPGSVPFEFSYFSRTLGQVTFTSMFEALSCEPSFTRFMTPIFGNMLGGTPITITLARGCSEQISGTPMCIFDDTETAAAVDDSGLAASGQHYFCSVPMFETAATPLFEFRAQLNTAGHGTLSLFGNFFLLPPYISHEVSVSTNESLLIDHDVTLTWSNDFSDAINVLPSTATVQSDIRLHVLPVSEEVNSFTTHTIRSGTTGDSELLIHDTDFGNLLESTQIVSGIFEVATTVTGLSTTDDFSFSRWSGVYLLASQPLSTTFRIELGSLCGVSEPGEATLLPSCPRTTALARLFNSGFRQETVSSTTDTMYSEQYYGYFHPSSSACFVQRQPQGPNALTQECCYDDSGLLLTDARDARPSLGTPLYESLSGMLMYHRATVLPFVYCCKEGLPEGDFTSPCSDFQSALSTDNGDGYVVLVPAILWGDPHINTLDGARYTFNGKGEFTILETDDNSFVVQGRLEQATDESGMPVQATVFTAIVAKTNTSDVVQMEVNGAGDGIEVRVNRALLNFSILSSQRFVGVEVTQQVDNTYQASFGGNYVVQVSGENGILSLLRVAPPAEAMRRTRGLLGNFNGDPSDDLIPRMASEPIPATSTLEEIHNQFGLTWILSSAADSLFYYRGAMSWADFHEPAFAPIFVPTFSDPALETQAMSLCAGDQACLYDVAVTGRLDIGMATRGGSEELAMFAALTVPVVCDPPCANGVCIANDSCYCPGFSGSTCSTPVFSACDQNVCANGGTCTQHDFEYRCDCPPDYSGLYCETYNPGNIYIVLGTVLGVAVVLTVVVIVAVLLCFKFMPQKYKEIRHHESQNDHELK